MATITIRLDSEEKELINNYTSTFGMNVSEFARRTILETIEDDIDTKIWDEAYQEYLNNPITFSNDEILAKYGDS